MEKAQYNLQLKVSTPPTGRYLMLGLKAAYKAETGAKQMDPLGHLPLFINVKPRTLASSDPIGGLNLEYVNMIQETGHIATVTPK
jgi:hypothetical protein